MLCAPPGPSLSGRACVPRAIGPRGMAPIHAETDPPPCGYASAWSPHPALSPDSLRRGDGRHSAPIARPPCGPAVRTCRSTQIRLEDLAGRASRAADLLRTRINHSMQEQNQKLLTSMNQRAHLQLRLQETVEGLSIVAISYYAVSLASYLLYPLTKAGISKGMLTALVTLPVVALVWWSVRRIRKRLG